MVGGGSLVLALPALLGLRRRYPTVEFVLVTTPAVEPFAKLLGVFDRIVLIDDRSLIGAVHTTICAWLDTLRADTFIDLEVYSRLTTAASTLSAARNRIGFYLETHFWRKHIHTHLIYFNRWAGVHIFYEQIARLLGASPATAKTCREQLLKSLPAVETSDRKRISIGHACSELGRERMLNQDQWLAFMREKLDDREEVEVHFLGADADRELATSIIQMAAPLHPQVIFHNQCGRLSLVQATALLRDSQEFWGIDSAPLHLARTLGIPTCSFWGPTHPDTRLKPMSDVQEDIRYHPVPCSPCIHIGETPPCLGNNVCIQRLFDSADRERPPESPTISPN